MNFIEEAIKRLDLESIARDVMSKLIITDLDLFFLVDVKPDSETWDFIGMTYSEVAARKLADTKKNDLHKPSILKVDMGMMVTIMERLGGTKRIDV